MKIAAIVRHVNDNILTPTEGIQKIDLLIRIYERELNEKVTINEYKLRHYPVQEQHQEAVRFYQRIKRALCNSCDRAVDKNVGGVE